ncbi:MAG: hypothetical protein GWM88_13465 [Pseudomonadales bacterium]|nr:hypothetical protein [Pseudomonadales bacterium]NIX08951.1 hypothetical protein [Pseudomonadales bacterium]
MSNAPDGEFLVFAGPDSDNDRFICDAGEPCGAYPLLDRLQLINVDGDKSGVNFTVGHDIPLDSLATEYESEARSGISRIVVPLREVDAE